jgi:hypothetical protein
MKIQCHTVLKSLIVFSLIGAGWAQADTSSVETKRVTTTEETTTPSGNGTMAPSAVAKDLTTAPPVGPALRWRELSGKVTHTNAEKQMVEIKLKNGEYIGVPVDVATVGFYKNEHQYAFADLKPGDRVTVRNLATNF